MNDEAVISDNGSRRGGSSHGRALLPGEVRGPRGGILRPIQKGETRNPYGVRHTRYVEVRRLCADHSVEATLELINLIADSDSRVRYMACMAVLERGVGKPRDHSGEEDMTARIDLSLLSKEEKDNLANLLRRVFGIEQP